MIGLMEPKLDYIFKNIFGVKKNNQVLLSFLKNPIFTDKKFLDVKEVQAAMEPLGHMSSDDKMRAIAEPITKKHQRTQSCA